MVPVISQTIVPSGLISVEIRGKKSAGDTSGEYGGCFSVVTLLFAKESSNKATGVLEHSRKVETNCWFSVFTTSVRRRRLSSTFLYSQFLHKFPLCSNSCKLYQRIPGTFWRFCVCVCVCARACIYIYITEEVKVKWFRYRPGVAQRVGRGVEV